MADNSLEDRISKLAQAWQRAYHMASEAMTDAGSGDDANHFGRLVADHVAGHFMDDLSLLDDSFR